MDQTRLSPVDRAAAVADSVLAPAAERVDTTGVIPQSHFDALADAGLFGMVGPSAAGGLDVAAPAARRIMASIAGGCGATFFVWAQHHGVVRTLAQAGTTAKHDALLKSLCAGEQIAGIAFAHARRAGSRSLRAHRVEGGWRLDGFAPWTTSWGIAQHFLIAAETADGQLVWSLISADATDGIAAELLPLPVLTATGTVALRVEHRVVADADVLWMTDADAWRAADRRTASIGNPAIFGVADRAIRLLDDVARSASDPAVSAAGRLRSDLDARWADDDRFVPRVSDFDDDDIVAASTHRARCLELGQQATTALLAASGGRGLDLRYPAQRLAREAMFYVIQAQTNDGRTGTLNHRPG